MTEANNGTNLKTTKIRKQLHYKQATFLQDSTVTLQDLLQKALRKLTVRKRHETISEVNSDGSGTPSQEWMRLINSPRVFAGCNCGVMVLYSSSLHRMVIDTEVNKNSDELDVSKLPPPAGKQFIETPLYFAIRDNHIVVLQSISLRADALESHLNWLLFTAGYIDEKQRIELSDVIPEETRIKLAKSPVKSIQLRGAFFEQASSPVYESGKGGDVTKSLKVATGMGLNLLKSILPKNQYSALKVEEMIDIPDVQIRLEIRVVGKKKDDKTDDRVMRNIMNSLRHVEDADLVQVEVEGVGTIKGEAMRVHDHKTIDSIDGVLETADAFDVMQRWLVTLVDKGTIRADAN